MFVELSIVLLDLNVAILFIRLFLQKPIAKLQSRKRIRSQFLLVVKVFDPSELV